MPKKIILFAFCFVFLLAGCDQTPKSPEVVFCQADAKVCSDGSSVSRVPPSCEFPACSINSAQMPAQQISVSDVPVYDCVEDSTDQTSCPVVGDTVIKMTTNHGEIWLKLFPSETPKTAENFVGLSERGFYNGLIFHRVIPSFMIQGGDPLGTGTGGESIWGGEFADEFSADLSNRRGSIAMANRGPATNTSQFFINQADNNFLDSKHTVFGQVVAGMRVVDEIANVEKGAMDKPSEDVTMELAVYEVVENAVE
jgi:peptidyl-prolyl cis-trans isomerase B (cyclophilin B)